MKRGTSAAVIAIGLLLVVGGSNPAFAQNLLLNPEFDTDLLSWSVTGGCAWDGSNDVDGSPASGSVACTGTAAAIENGAQSTGVTQCVGGITPGTSYTFGGSILLTSVPAGVGARHAVLFYSDAACLTPALSAVVTPTVTAIGSWEETSASAVAPAGAVAVRIVENMTLSANAGDFEVNFDRVFVEQTVHVPAMSRAFLAALAALLLLVAAAALRRPVVGPA